MWVHSSAGNYWEHGRLKVGTGQSKQPIGGVANICGHSVWSMFVATSLILKLVRKTRLKCKPKDKIRSPNKGVEVEFLPQGLLLGRTVRKLKIF